ncbi:MULTISPECIES: hypothetical protein [Mycolicibacterium]|uniref:hypothetical protein n=1 Tax=Mycolicibacterium TaxID=1866885 RepID=UPI001E3A3CC9|nr:MULTISPECIES: hypothetical protein [Mycolicibacterium]
MSDGELRRSPQAVYPAAMVDVFGVVRLSRQLVQRGPGAVRRQVAAFLDRHDV